IASAGLSVGTQVTTRGLLLGRSVVAEVNLAVRSYGLSTQAAAYLGRSAYTYYLANAVAVNTNIIVATEIGLTIAGQDTGPISVGDSIVMATQVDDAARAGVKVWKRVRADVLEADAAAGKAVIRVTSLETISDDVAKVEFDLGKKVIGESKS